MLKIRGKYEERSFNYRPAERVISRSLTFLGSGPGITLLEDDSL